MKIVITQNHVVLLALLLLVVPVLGAINNPGHSWIEMDCDSNVCVNTTSGYVGIGDSTPSYDLDVTGNIRATSDLIAGDDVTFYGDLYPDGSSCTAGQILQKTADNNWDCVNMPSVGIGGSGTDNYIPRWNGASALQNSVIYQTDTNYVGIWTTSPGAPLDVVSPGSGTTGGLRVRTAASDAAPAYIQFTNNAASAQIGLIAADTSSNLRFYTAGTERLTILNTNGNVGIGTTSPGAKLEVAGQVKITGGSPGAGKVLISDASGLASWGSKLSCTYNSQNIANGGQAGFMCPSGYVATGVNCYQAYLNTVLDCSCSWSGTQSGLCYDSGANGVVSVMSYICCQQ